MSCQPPSSSGLAFPQPYSMPVEAALSIPSSSLPLLLSFAISPSSVESPQLFAPYQGPPLNACLSQPALCLSLHLTASRCHICFNSFCLAPALSQCLPLSLCHPLSHAPSLQVTKGPAGCCELCSSPSPRLPPWTCPPLVTITLGWNGILQCPRRTHRQHMGTRWRQIPQKTNHFGQGSRPRGGHASQKNKGPQSCQTPPRSLLGCAGHWIRRHRVVVVPRAGHQEQPKAEEQSHQNQAVLLPTSQATDNMPLGPAPPLPGCVTLGKSLNLSVSSPVNQK